MIIISATEYKEKMGGSWSPGILRDTLSVMQMEWREFYGNMDNLADSTSDFVKNKTQWDIDDVVVLYLTFEAVEDILDIEEKEDLQKLIVSRIVPCLIFSDKNVKTIDYLVEMVNRIYNLKVFL